MPDQRPFLARRLKLWELVAVDAAAAVGLLLAHLSFLDLPADASQLGYTGPLWFGWLFSVVATVPVAVRRLWPWPVLVLTFLGSAVATVFNATREPWVPVAAVLYILAVTNRKPVVALATTLASLVVAVLAAVLFTPPEFSHLPREIFLAVTLVMVATWAVGRWVEARRSYTARSAEQLAQSMVGDERLRIARELHDVVAHSMSLIAVKAGIANHIADQRPQEARDALRVIEETSRNTLVEMRQLLGILRSTPELPAPHRRLPTDDPTEGRHAAGARDARLSRQDARDPSTQDPAADLPERPITAAVASPPRPGSAGHSSDIAHGCAEGQSVGDAPVPGSEASGPGRGFSSQARDPAGSGSGRTENLADSPVSAPHRPDGAAFARRPRAWLAGVARSIRAGGGSAEGAGSPRFGQRDRGLELAPAPGLSDLPALAAQARSAGVAVTMGAAPSVSLPSGLELSAYRIVQEALTNVVKHAGPVPCAVDVSFADGALRISVVDSGRGDVSRMPASGHGLIGMRERVMMYGGQFSAGRLPSGGFAVSASLPCPGARS